MNSPTKKLPGARGIPQLFKARMGPAHQFKPPAQLKNVLPSQSAKSPVAPPVYNPQPVPRVLQTKKIVRDVGGRSHMPQKPVVARTFQAQASQLQFKGVTNPSVLKSAGAARPRRYEPQSKLPSRTLQRAQAAVQQTTHVSLHIGDEEFTGSASGQYGHAEMEALRKFLMNYETSQAAWEALQAMNRSVSCTRIPVCGSCSAVLIALGFKVHEVATKFSEEKSGGVSWGGNLKVEGFMKDIGKSEIYKAAKLAGQKG